MLYCSDWTRSWSWWMGRQVAPTESSRGQNGASTVLPFHDWGRRGGGGRAVGLVMGVREKKNQSESGWLALGIHLGLNRSSLFPDCSSAQLWDRNQATIKIPPSTAACRGTMSSYPAAQDMTSPPMRLP